MTEFLTFEEATAETAVALGVFDGVHIGHRAVLEEAVKSDGLEPWVFTFSEKNLPTGKKGVHRLEPPDVKFNIMKKCGIAHIYAPDFDDVKSLSGEEFFKKILVEHLHCKKVACGEDFRFGKNASCNAEDMKRFCKENNMECAVIKKLQSDGSDISSTRIRAAAENGDMEEVIKLCDYPFCIESKVVSGKHLGREFGIPTINQTFDKDYVIPKYGVYVSATMIDGKFYPSVTNVGVKPTVSDENIPGAETNIIGFSGDLYGKNIFVFLLSFVREEMTFKSKEALFSRISFDRMNAEEKAMRWIRTKAEATASLMGVEK